MAVQRAAISVKVKTERWKLKSEKCTLLRLGLDKEIAPDGTYLAYFPFGAMIERSRMAPYREKLFLVRRGQIWL